MNRYMYPLQNDLVFKAVFGRNTNESKEALIRMLNAILKDGHHDHIQQITHKNPYLEQSHVEEKVAILDIKAVTDQGEQINIEMQVGAQKGFRKRLLYYGSKLHGEQLHQGESYDALKKTISIAIVSNIVLPETKKAHAVFNLMEKTEHFCFVDDFEIHCVQLPYVDDIMDIDEMDELTALMTLIKDIHLPQKQEMIEKLKEKKEVVRMAINEYEKVTQDEMFREQLAAREKYEHDIASWIYEAKAEGIQEGREEGREEGIMKEKYEVAKKLKAEGFPIEMIVKLTGLSQGTIESIK